MKLDINEMRQQAGLPPQEDHVIARADEFTVVLDDDEYVHLLDGEGNVRVSMPHDIWEQLRKSSGA